MSLMLNGVILDPVAVFLVKGEQTLINIMVKLLLTSSRKCQLHPFANILIIT